LNRWVTHFEASLQEWLLDEVYFIIQLRHRFKPYVTARHSMKKTAEQEVNLKLAIRNIIVRNPLISGHQLCRDLAEQKFTTAQGNPLDWFYVAKIVRKLSRESALAAATESDSDRK
jgi:hypothetical protein